MHPSPAFAGDGHGSWWAVFSCAVPGMVRMSQVQGLKFLIVGPFRRASALSFGNVGRGIAGKRFFNNLNSTLWEGTHKGLKSRF